MNPISFFPTFASIENPFFLKFVFRDYKYNTFQLKQIECLGLSIACQKTRQLN